MENYLYIQIQKRFLVLSIISLGFSFLIAGQITGIHAKTVTAIVKKFNEGGFEAVQHLNYNKPQSDLESSKLDIIEHLAKFPSRTIPEACHQINMLTGIKRSSTQVRAFLKRCNFKRRKAGQVPANPKEQKKFLRNILQPRLREAKKGLRSMLFMDAAHIVHAPYLGHIWSVEPVSIQAPSGRARLNVVGTIDAIAHETTFITNDNYVTATTIVDFLRVVHKKYPNKKVTLVLDNARYQHTPIVTSLAKELGIELLYLPAYSPNLNLIERFWKLLKKEILYCRYYPTFEEFSREITTFLKNVCKTKTTEFATLMTLNFHIFPELQNLAE